MTRAIIRGSDGVSRCWWAVGSESYRAYHDKEWGRPTLDDRWIFAKLCLEGFQSGLSWLTILNKRENFQVSTPVEKVPVVAVENVPPSWG